MNNLFTKAKRGLKKRVIELLALPANTTPATFTNFIEKPEAGYLDNKFLAGVNTTPKKLETEAKQPAKHQQDVPEEAPIVEALAASGLEAAGVAEAGQEMRTRNAAAPKDAGKGAAPRREENGVFSCRSRKFGSNSLVLLQLQASSAVRAALQFTALSASNNICCFLHLYSYHSALCTAVLSV